MNRPNPSLKHQCYWTGARDTAHGLYGSRLHMLVLMLFAWTLAWSQTVSGASLAIKIVPGAGSFLFVAGVDTLINQALAEMGRK